MANIQSNSELRDTLSQSQKAVFHLCDLHVHSPGSFDFKGLSPDLKALQKTIRGQSRAEYERKFLVQYIPERYYEQLLEQFQATLKKHAPSYAHSWGIIGLTDHNVAGYACELSRFAWENRKKNRLIVLPGIELDVKFKVPETQSFAKIHILLHFPPNTEVTDLTAAISGASGGAWAYGEELVVDSLPEFVKAIRNTPLKPICTAAHIASSKGIQSASKEEYSAFYAEQTEIARIHGELQREELGDLEKEDLETKLAELEAALRPEIEQKASMAVLALIGKCGFDALQMTSIEQAKHYRRLHRFREGDGRAVPILCSDAHNAESIFDCAGQQPFLKLHHLSAAQTGIDLVESIRNKGLRFGETRFRTYLPEKPRCWIAGIEIARDSTEAATFWTDSTPFQLSLSPNLNCLVGGRGAGKSSLIEAVSLAQDVDDFSRSGGGDDWFKRANATLQGCRVRVWWQYSPAPPELPKGSVFADSYFPENAKNFQPIQMTDVNAAPLEGKQYPECQVEIYRVQDIEEVAKPDRLASLFDDLCGDELILSLAQIESKRGELAIQRALMVVVARSLASLTTFDAPLLNYAPRHEAYERVNKPELKAKFARLDRAEAAKTAYITYNDSWDSSKTTLGAEPFSSLVEEMIEGLSEKLMGEEDDFDCSQKLKDKLLGNAEDGTVGLLQESKTKLQELSQLHEKIDLAFSDAQNAIGEIVSNEKVELEIAGVPQGSKARGVKKTSYDEAVSDLEEYQRLISQWDELCLQRIGLRNELNELVKSRSLLREEKALFISKKLVEDLDENVLKIQVAARGGNNRDMFRKWLEDNIVCHLSRNRQQRLDSLAKATDPVSLVRSLLCEEQALGNEGCLVVDTPSQKQSDGYLSPEDALKLYTECCGRFKHTLSDEFDSIKSELPAEVQGGIWVFPHDEGGEPRVDAVLALDEIVDEDTPVILLNDRPRESTSMFREIGELSPGQRCSAVLPILLLNGTTPIIIDQPEDNLDNRLIRQVVVNILSSMKLRRQVVLATHNPNIPVLGDAEQTVVLRAVNDKDGEVQAVGDLDSSEIVRCITDVMEGGREAFQYRNSIYQTHWRGPVANS